MKKKIASWFIKLAELILLDNKIPRLLVFLGNKIDPTTDNYTSVIVKSKSQPIIIRNRFRR